LDGVEATRRILASRPETKIIALTGYPTLDYLDDMLTAGAVGFVSKGSEPSEIKRAIDKVVKGGFYLDPSSHKIVLENYLNLLSGSPRSKSSVTPRCDPS
jgi:DNA-binding NarL/FixJ family response regulator